MAIKSITKQGKYAVVLTGLLCVSVSASADTANIPNTFMAGQAAVAQDVNDNFTALKSAIDGNAARIPVLKDGNGAIKGSVMSTEYHVISLMSDKAYMFNFYSQTGDMAIFPLFYVSTNCTGTAYSRKIQSVLFDGTDYLYVPKGSSPQPVNAGSMLLEGTGGCILSSYSDDMYQTYANDPAITGVENSPLLLPLSFDTQ